MADGFARRLLIIAVIACVLLWLFEVLIVPGVLRRLL